MYTGILQITSLNDNATRLTISFDDNANTVVIHTSMKVTPSTLLSNIGGTMGLCVGASLLSLVHAFVSIFFCCRCRRKTDKLTVATLA